MIFSYSFLKTQPKARKQSVRELCRTEEVAIRRILEKNVNRVHELYSENLFLPIRTT